MTSSSGDDQPVERNKAQFPLLQEEVVSKKRVERVELVEQIMASDISVKRRSAIRTEGSSRAGRCSPPLPHRPSDCASVLVIRNRLHPPAILAAAVDVVFGGRLVNAG